MLRYIRVVPLAAESLGVRSMCTYVETPDVKVLLDAGVSLCPDRFRLPPHPKEFKAIEEARRRIAEAADKAEVVTVSHYHFDHHTPSYEDWLSNWTASNETATQIYAYKTVLVKNPKEKINYSQRRRGWMFQKTGGKYAKKLESADGKTFTYGRDTMLRFSEPVSHGPADSALGWVLMTTVNYQGERFMHAPDVQGPMVTSTLKIILKDKPQLLMIGGPPLYLAGFKVGDQQIQTGLKNFGEIVKVIPNVILDHHILRDEDWREKTKTAIPDAWRRKSKILTAAECLGEKNLFLESMRKRLFAEEPLSRDFEKWMNQSVDVKKHVRPPI
jgi:predicted metallo-beta-lactamase superfamily hydrolase